jgi:hypothetical protein
MQRLVLFMLVAATTFEFLVKGDYWGRMSVLPMPFQFVPELLSAAVAVAVVARGPATQFRLVRPQYWLVFGAILVVMLAGVIANAVEPGPVFAGIRNYMRAIPWFFVGAIYAFSEKQLGSQLRLLCAIALLQLPLAVDQRLQTAHPTGDWTTGTLLISSIMSIYLINCICVAAAFYVRRRLALRQFLLLAMLMFVPTMINETKGTLILLPLGLLLAFVATAAPGRRFKDIALAFSLVAAAGAIYVPVYNYLVQEREYAATIGEFWSDSERLERYVWTKGEVGTTVKGGRLDAILVPARALAEDPVRLAFGYGIGNVSRSTLGQRYSGEYHELFNPFMQNAFARLILEIGVLGLSLVILLMWMILRDAKIVARQDGGLMGALAGGWVAVSAIMLLSILYKDATTLVSLSYLFWYFSGIVTAARMRALLQGNDGLPTVPIVVARPA